ncbi:amidohydrolase [Halovenus marina]|uniref:amidohydrolase n=1 Tax=Halovenus marina TaxID=3396621 RepID=UPI003F564C93
MATERTKDWLVDVRRDLHRRPEPGWCEFYTTARIVEKLEQMPVAVTLGPDLLDADARQGVPDSATLSEWLNRARETDADPDLLDQMEGGLTGALATLDRGDGPTIALRVDIDGLPRTESADDGHHPTAEGFRSVHDGHMHACGHDAHTAIGLGVLQTVAESDFEGTLKVVFQPAEEVIGGGRPVAEGGHLNDVDALFAVHIGLTYPTGTVVGGFSDFLAVAHLDMEFTGEGSHAGAHPNGGRNAVQAMATAVENMYGIARHTDGRTRVNAGRVGGGTASNIIPEEAFIEGEVRGGTTELREYMRRRVTQVCESAASMHDCSVSIEEGAEAPSAESDEELVDQIARAADANERVDSIVRRDEFRGSEDATFLMKRVQERGGLATYLGIGTDHPGGHHSATFDVDERSLPIGVEVISDAIRSTARDLSE